MAAQAQSQSSQPLQRRPKRKRMHQHSEHERVDLLPWNAALSSDDPFSLFIGSNELEGGFLSLEEIDEADYGLELTKPEIGSTKSKSKAVKKSKQQKPSDVDGNGNESCNEVASKIEGEMELDEILNTKKKGKKKENKKKKDFTKDIQENKESVAVDVSKSAENESGKDCKLETKKKGKNKKRETNEIRENKEAAPIKNFIDEVEEEPIDEALYYAWNELRLHPLLMKSIYRLGFKEPTPIQKSCIPAAAHQGKDVIGAAETGSGKTLAFGLPILQRLLEEREKDSRMLEQKGEEAGKYAPKGFLRALIITPTRELALQVTDHLNAVAEGTKIRVVPIVGGMSTEKQERLLRGRPEIIVGTPGRLWELMSGGEKHLVELHTLSFFVLDEADRMIENGHFRELQSIIDALPTTKEPAEGHSQSTQNCVTISSFQRKKRQTFVFSATIALSSDFRKKLKRGLLKSKQLGPESLNSIEALSERAGMRDNVAIIDLTNASILADKLEESFVECTEEDKDAHLYYILTVHGQGRTIVFCTSIAALRHIAAILRILGVNVWTLHAQMQQRARLKAIDRFRANEHGILIATDVAARGLDIPGVRTVVHYQLPHSAEVYVHRSGRTARASADGCSIALITPNETSKFASLCKSFSKESFQRFPLDSSYMPEVVKRMSLAYQIDKILRKDSQEKARKSWLERNAESVELLVDNSDSEEERVNNYKKKKVSSLQLKKLQQELNKLLSRPLQPKSFSHRYLAGAGVSSVLQCQFEELARPKISDSSSGDNNRRKLVVIGQNCVEPLQALRKGGLKVQMDVKETSEKRRNMENLRRKRKEEKKRLRDQRRKQKKKSKGDMY